jgi:O-acetylserine/cysteine efflux transporter
MPSRHALLAVAVAVVWGLNFVVLHVALETFPPLGLVALRFLLVALPAVFLVGRPGTSWRWVLAIGATMSAGQFAFLFVAMDRGLPAGLASLVLQLQVFFTVLLAVALLGERLRGSQAAGAGVAFAGIAVIGAGRAEDVPLLAVVLAIAAAASWAVGNVCARRAQSPRPLALIVWSSLVPPVPLLALSAGLEGPAALGDAIAAVDLAAVGALAYLVLGATFFGYGSWVWLLRRHPASRVVPFTLLVPVVGIASAWALLDEVPNRAELAGAGLVLAGLAMNTWATSARRERVALAAAAAPA